MTRVVIIGGGPGGYEAALVGSQLGGEVVLIDSDGIGGSAVLSDCVPSKTLVAVADAKTRVIEGHELGLRFGPDDDREVVGVDLAAVNARIKNLALAQSSDIREKLIEEGVRLVDGRGRFDGEHRVIATTADGTEEAFDADIALIATGARPRVMPTAVPDGERILDWTQVYDLDELPERLIVVGSGVTGAEFAGAYDALGVDVVLVSSRDMVLPGEDPDAARVLQDVFERQGMEILSRARAASAVRNGDQVTVTCEDGRTVTGSHVLMAVGSIPNTADLMLDEAGIATDDRGYVTVDKVSRTSRRTVYAAGDCTGVLPLASVAAMQGRIAMWHALGDAVAPLDVSSVAANVFTSPQIATVGATQAKVDSGEVRAVSYTMPLETNARAKMIGLADGFVKIFCLPATGIIVGGVIVAPQASELIHPLSIAVAERITVDQLSHDFTVYPSLSGSIAEAARRMRGHADFELETH
ncbi:MAG: NAD(P)H-quinone dehydrogenase [Propionibacterium sp.]|nr:NAD(P)H-quinone dehydrogenase [Propionibacterium sp.]